MLLLGSLTAMAPLGVGMYLPALPHIARDFQVGDAVAQQTMSVFLMGLSLGQVLYGPISDRHGRRRPMLVGVALFLVGTVGCMLAPTAAALIAFRLVQALGACAGNVLSRAVVRDMFAPRDILHVLSLLMLVNGLASTVAPIVGAGLLGHGSWRLTFAWQVALGGAIGLASWWRLKESLRPEFATQARREHPLRSYAALLRNRRFLAYLLSGALSSGAIFTYMASSPDILITQMHISPTLFGWIYAGNATAIIAGAQINARLAKRWTSHLILRGTLWGSVLLCVLLAAASVTGIGGQIGFVAILCLINATYAFTGTNAQAEALKIDPTRAGASSALMGAAIYGTGAAGAAVTAVLRDGTALPMAVVMTATFAIALWAVSFLAPRRGQAG